MKNFFILPCLIATAFSLSAAEGGHVKLTSDDKKILIEIDGKPFSTYYFDDGGGIPFRRPFFFAGQSR